MLLLYQRGHKAPWASGLALALAVLLVLSCSAALHADADHGTPPPPPPPGTDPPLHEQVQRVRPTIHNTREELMHLRHHSGHVRRMRVRHNATTHGDLVVLNDVATLLKVTCTQTALTLEFGDGAAAAAMLLALHIGVPIHARAAFLRAEWGCDEGTALYRTVRGAASAPTAHSVTVPTQDARPNAMFAEGSAFEAWVEKEAVTDLPRAAALYTAAASHGRGNATLQRHFTQQSSDGFQWALPLDEGTYWRDVNYPDWASIFTAWSVPDCPALVVHTIELYCTARGAIFASYQLVGRRDLDAESMRAQQTTFFTPMTAGNRQCFFRMIHKASGAQEMRCNNRAFSTSASEVFFIGGSNPSDALIVSPSIFYEFDPGSALTVQVAYTGSRGTSSSLCIMQSAWVWSWEGGTCVYETTIDMTQQNPSVTITIPRDLYQRRSASRNPLFFIRIRHEGRFTSRYLNSQYFFISNPFESRDSGKHTLVDFDCSSSCPTSTGLNSRLCPACSFLTRASALATVTRDVQFAATVNYFYWDSSFQYVIGASYDFDGTLTFEANADAAFEHEVPLPLPKLSGLNYGHTFTFSGVDFEFSLVAGVQASIAIDAEFAARIETSGQLRAAGVAVFQNVNSAALNGFEATHATFIPDTKDLSGHVKLGLHLTVMPRLELRLHTYFHGEATFRFALRAQLHIAYPALPPVTDETEFPLPDACRSSHHVQVMGLVAHGFTSQLGGSLIGGSPFQPLPPLEFRALDARCYVSAGSRTVASRTFTLNVKSSVPAAQREFLVRASIIVAVAAALRIDRSKVNVQFPATTSSSVRRFDAQSLNSVTVAVEGSESVWAAAPDRIDITTSADPLIVHEPSCDHDTCDACTASSSCGWCAATSSCHGGSASGPSEGSCATSSWYFGSSATCPATCASLSSCDTCTQSSSGCAWCGGSESRCIAAASSCSSGTKATTTAHCPVDANCVSKSNCDDCALSEHCGWCAATSSCREGSASGPSEGSCAADWKYTDAQCSGVVTPHCEQHTSCSACGAETLCGWCSDAGPLRQGACLEGGLGGPITMTCSGLWAPSADRCGGGGAAPAKEKESGLSGGAIAGIVVAVLVVTALAATGAVYMLILRPRKEQPPCVSSKSDTINVIAMGRDMDTFHEPMIQMPDNNPTYPAVDVDL